MWLVKAHNQGLVKCLRWQSIWYASMRSWVWIPTNPTKYPILQCWGSEDREIPRSFWPASPDNLINSRFNERCDLKICGRERVKKTPNAGLQPKHTCIPVFSSNTHTHTQLTCIYTYAKMPVGEYLMFRAWCCWPVITATLEAETVRLQVQDQPGILVTSHLKNNIFEKH